MSLFEKDFIEQASYYVKSFGKIEIIDPYMNFLILVLDKAYVYKSVSKTHNPNSTFGYDFGELQNPEDYEKAYKFIVEVIRIYTELHKERKLSKQNLDDYYNEIVYVLQRMHDYMVKPRHYY